MSAAPARWRRTAAKLSVSPETLTDCAARLIKHDELARRRREEWRSDIAEWRRLDGGWARWQYALSILFGQLVVATAGLARATVARLRSMRGALTETGLHLLGVTPVLLLPMLSHSPGLLVLVMVLVPFAVRTGLLVVAGLGVALLSGVLWVSGRKRRRTRRRGLRRRCRLIFRLLCRVLLSRRE